MAATSDWLSLLESHKEFTAVGILGQLASPTLPET